MDGCNTHNELYFAAGSVKNLSWSIAVEGRSSSFEDRRIACRQSRLQQARNDRQGGVIKEKRLNMLIVARPEAGSSPNDLTAKVTDVPVGNSWARVSE